MQFQVQSNNLELDEFKRAIKLHSLIQKAHITPQEQPLLLVMCHFNAHCTTRYFGLLERPSSDANSAGFLSPWYQNVKKWSWNLSLLSPPFSTSTTNMPVLGQSAMNKHVGSLNGINACSLLIALDLSPKMSNKTLFGDWSSFLSYLQSLSPQVAEQQRVGMYLQIIQEITLKPSLPLIA